jgi:hypothetical protein
MYFGGDSSFNHFNPKDFTANSPSLPVFVSSYKLSNQAEQTTLFEKLKTLKVTEMDLPITLKLSNRSV